jgi:hypothetical protein
MPRRPAVVEEDIPLYLVPHLVKRGVHTHGAELERVIVQRSQYHFYSVSIRTRPIKRELESREPSRRGTKQQKAGEPGELA